MESIFSAIRHAFKALMDNLPPLVDFFPPTQQAYAVLVSGFQYFPVFTILQWLLPYHPAGKTSSPKPTKNLLNLPGKPAWFAMEIVSPVTLLYTIWSLMPQQTQRFDFPLPNAAAASFFVLHYLNRAVVSPFLAAPSMSPIHVFVVVMAGLFNYVNATCLGCWLVGYSVSVRGPSDGEGRRVYKTDGMDYYSDSVPDNTTLVAIIAETLPILGVALFFVGMTGNIYSERRLFRLRREEGEKRAAEEQQLRKVKGFLSLENTTIKDNNDNETSNRNKYHKVYVLPPAKGIFRSILFPHYVFEWLEWFGFVLIGTAIFPFPSITKPSSYSYSNSTNTTTTTPTITLVPWLVPFAVLAEVLHVPLPLPALLFLVNAVANMLPHARWGRRWYVDKFGEKAVGVRGAVVPCCSWL